MLLHISFYFIFCFFPSKKPSKKAIKNRLIKISKNLYDLNVNKIYIYIFSNWQFHNHVLWFVDFTNKNTTKNSLKIKTFALSAL